MHADKVVFTGEFELHRLVGRFGKHGGHVIVILRLILVTETTAHVLTDDPHFAQRQAEVFCDIGARVRNALRRSINGQLAGIPPGDAHASLHLRIVDVLGDEGVFEDLVRFLESLFHISPGFFDGRAERPLADRQVPVWGNFRGIWFERFISVEHMRNFFIVDLDQFQRVFSDVPVGGRHGGNRIADIAHRIVENITPVREPAARPRHLGIAVMNDRFDTRQLFGFRRVDAGNFRMRHAAPEHACIKHPREL